MPCLPHLGVPENDKAQFSWLLAHSAGDAAGTLATCESFEAASGAGKSKIFMQAAAARASFSWAATLHAAVRKGAFAAV